MHDRQNIKTIYIFVFCYSSKVAIIVTEICRSNDLVHLNRYKWVVISILIDDIPLCFNNHNKTISLFRDEHNNSIWFWYLIVFIKTLSVEINVNTAILDLVL